MIDLGKLLAEDIQKLDRQIKQAAHERDESATPTESTHDQTRQIANQLFNSLLEEKAKLQKLKNVAKRFTKVLTIEDENGQISKIMPVPEGLGGKSINGVLLLSDNSLLGQKIRELHAGDSYELNGRNYKIISLDS